MSTFYQVIDNWRIAAVKLPLRRSGQNEEHPNVQANNQEKLENYFTDHIFTQIQSPINDNEEELNDQHEQKCDRDFILLKVRQNTRITTSSLDIDEKVFNDISFKIL